MPDIKLTSEAVGPSEIEKIRQKLDKGFTKLAGLINAAEQPLPTKTGDGTYIPEANDDPSIVQKIEAGLKDLSYLGINDIKTLIEVQDKTKNLTPWDDKAYLMERLIQTAAKFPDDSPTGKTVTNGFLTGLYNDLQHPPSSYLGKDYFYRSADGSNNSLLHPNLGKANTPYARTVAPKKMQPGALPDAGDIFDSIMSRTAENTTEHPNKISVMLFYLASIIIHDLFRTDHQNFYNSKTSSYLDLAPLYGSNLEEQLRMRTRKDGVGVILVMFNRFHNNAVEMLARIKQDSRFTRPDGDWPTISPDDDKYPATWKKYDEELFQTARLITSGLYINIVLLDYVRTILNLNKTNSNWALNPRAEIPGVPVAAGNQVSAEFNLVYRWHAAISVRDEKWTNDLWKREFSDLDPETVDFHQFITAASKMEARLSALDPSERPLGHMQRSKDGTFDDDELVKELAASIDDPANSYGANRVPPVMRVIEILGIEQARAWNVASLNEFRKFFNLEPHQTFESINSDPKVADQLKHLYDHPDYVELYPGLVAEEAKKPCVPGAGLTPSYTVSRAVLSDAVALVRGDRFYTIDYDPKKLTNWGYTEAGSDVGINHGCVFYKLILTSFPFHFKSDSVYAHFPLTVTKEMIPTLKALGKDKVFSNDKPGRLPSIKVVSSYSGIDSILKNPGTFPPTVGSTAVSLLGEQAKTFTIAGVGKDNAAGAAMEKALYVDGTWGKQVRGYFETITAQLLEEKAYKLGKKNQVDIIRDIGNIAPVHFVSELFALPLKTTTYTLGVFTEHELYLIMTNIFLATYFDVDPIASFSLRSKSRSATQTLGDLVEANVREISAGGVFSRLISAIFAPKKPGPLKDYGIKLIQRLLESSKDIDDLVWGQILPTVAGITASTGQLYSQVLEFYLTNGHTEHWSTINKLAQDDTDVSFETLKRFVLEGVRLAGETGVFRDVTKATELQDGTKLVPGEKVLLNLHAASLDPKIFPSPEMVVLDRPLDAYINLGFGAPDSLIADITLTALTAMFKVVGRLNKLRPANGPQGKVHKVKAPYAEEGAEPRGAWYNLYLTETHDRLWPFPSAMRVNWG